MNRCDGWLDPYFSQLNTEPTDATTSILEIGCGTGDDTSWLLAKNFQLTSIDVDPNRCNLVASLFPDAKVICGSVLDLPKLVTSKFDYIIAGLSLHYFTRNEMTILESVLASALRNNGFLIARVNSVFDFNYGAGQGREIEKNVFIVNGQQKRFFSFDEIDDLFIKYFKLTRKKEAFTNKYGEVKNTIEFEMQKIL